MTFQFYTCHALDATKQEQYAVSDDFFFANKLVEKHHSSNVRLLLVTNYNSRIHRGIESAYYHCLAWDVTTNELHDANGMYATIDDFFHYCVQYDILCDCVGRHCYRVHVHDVWETAIDSNDYQELGGHTEKTYRNNVNQDVQTYLEWLAHI